MHADASIIWEGNIKGAGPAKYCKDRCVKKANAVFVRERVSGKLRNRMMISTDRTVLAQKSVDSLHQIYRRIVECSKSAKHILSDRRLSEFNRRHGGPEPHSSVNRCEYLTACPKFVKKRSFGGNNCRF